VAENLNTNHAAAVVSALSGDAQNGLAYWGTGGIQITSTVAEKAGGGTWQVLSDARIKKDVAPLRLGLAQLKELRPVTFRYNGLGGTTDDGSEFVGVIAQELEKIFPAMVMSRKKKLHVNDATDTEIKVVDPSALTYVLINSVKEQQAIIDRQERRIATLERGRGVAASLLGDSAEMVLAFGLLPLGFVALRKRKGAKSTS
jgi:trimeric autotransporter adhesin